MIEQNTSYCDFRRLNQLLKIKIMTEKNADVIKNDVVLQGVIEEAQGKTCEELLGFLKSILNSFALDLEDIQQREYTLTDKQCMGLNALCKAMDAKDESFKEISLNVLPQLLAPFKDADGNVGDTMAMKTALFNTYTNALSGLTNALGVAEANLTYVDDDVDLGIMQAIDYLTSYFETCSDEIGYGVAVAVESSAETMVELETAETVVQVLDGMEGFLDGSVDRNNLTDNQKVVTSLLYAMDDRVFAYAGNEGFVDTAKEWINKLITWIRNGINTVKGWFSSDKARKDANKLKNAEVISGYLEKAIVDANETKDVPKTEFDSIISLLKANGVDEGDIKQLSGLTTASGFTKKVSSLIKGRLKTAIHDAQHRSEQLSLMNKIESEISKVSSNVKGDMSESEMNSLKKQVSELKTEFEAIEKDIKRQSKETEFLTKTADRILSVARGKAIVNKLDASLDRTKLIVTQADLDKFMLGDEPLKL